MPRALTLAGHAPVAHGPVAGESSRGSASRPAGRRAWRACPAAAARAVPSRRRSSGASQRGPIGRRKYAACPYLAMYSDFAFTLIRDRSRRGVVFRAVCSAASTRRCCGDFRRLIRASRSARSLAADPSSVARRRWYRHPAVFARPRARRSARSGQRGDPAWGYLRFSWTARRTAFSIDKSAILQSLTAKFMARCAVAWAIG